MHFGVTPALARQGARHFPSLPSIGESMARRSNRRIAAANGRHSVGWSTSTCRNRPEDSGTGATWCPLIRSLYGGRDAPMRWRITLSKRLRAHGYRQLPCDVRTFAQYNGKQELIASLVWHGDDILFTGTEAELLVTEKGIRTFRAVEIAELTPSRQLTTLAFC